MKGFILFAANCFTFILLYVLCIQLLSNNPENFGTIIIVYAIFAFLLGSIYTALNDTKKVVVYRNNTLEILEKTYRKWGPEYYHRVPMVRIVEEVTGMTFSEANRLVESWETHEEQPIPKVYKELLNLIIDEPKS